MEPNEVYAGTSAPNYSSAPNLQPKKLIKRRQVVQEWATTDLGATNGIDAPHRIIEMENEEDQEEDDNS